MKTEILRLDNVSLQMSGIMQLERFNLQIFSGEIMGLMALNAHGVSSLVSLLQSNTPVHFGRVYYCEQLVNSHIYSRTTPNEIVVIEQKSHLVNGLTVGDNVFVLSGVERRWLLHTQSFRGRLQELEQAVGVDIPCNRQVEELSLFERCMVELLKAWESGARLVLLWNISHFLAGTDIGRLHYAIRHFASRGMAFIYISNSYEELCGLCDRIAVMYNGSVIKVQEMVSGGSEDIHALLQQFTGTTSSPPRSAMSQPEQRQYGTAETGGSCGIQRRMSRDPYGRPAAAGWNAATGYGTERTARRKSSDRWTADPPADGAGSAGRLYCRKSFTNDAVSGYELFAESHVLPASADRQLVSPAEHLPQPAARADAGAWRGF